MLELTQVFEGFAGVQQIAELVFAFGVVFLLLFNKSGQVRPQLESGPQSFVRSS